MALVSVNTDGQHSIRSVLNWTQASVREGWYWQVDENTNTLIAILNSDEQPARVAFSLDYSLGQSKYSYDLPEITIGPHVSELINLRKTIAAGLPDRDGDVIPAGIKFGGYRARKIGPRTGASIVTEALITDRRHATWLTVYNTACCEFAWREPNSMTGPVGATGQIVVTVEDCSGSTSDGSVEAFYSGGNTSVAVDGSGGVSFEAPGTASITPTIAILRPYTSPRDGQIICRNDAFPMQPCQVTVKPGVKINGPAYIPLRAAGSSGPNSGVFTATSVDPTGGTYSWTTSSGKVTLANVNTSAVTVTAVSESAARSDVPISLSYTVNNQTTTVTAPITVVKPASLQLSSDSTNPTGHNCVAGSPTNNCMESSYSGSGSYNSYRRERLYLIMDHLSPPQWIAGYPLQIQEAFTAPSGTCASGGVVTGQGVGDGVTDCFYFCSETCRIGGSCNVSATQTLTVNGFVVGTKAVNWICSSVSVSP